MITDTTLWTQIGIVSDIPQRGARCVQIDAQTIAIFRGHDDQIYALEDICTNCDGPISQGIVGDRSVFCPICNWEIDLKTGEACGADVGQVAIYPVRLDGKAILLGLTPTSSKLVA